MQHATIKNQTVNLKLDRERLVSIVRLSDRILTLIRRFYEMLLLDVLLSKLKLS